MYTFDNDTSVLSKWIRDEVDFPGNIGKGKRNTAARRIQEWLCLHGHHIVVDSDFGNVTEDAVQAFQKSKGFSQSGVVDQKTHEALVKPMLTVLSHKPKKSLGFGAMVTNYAKAHLKQHPREVGGANRGPWVRMYMKGNEGKPWAWCAGFTTFLMEQTAETKDVAMPIKGSFSCDTLAAQAKNAGLFMRERDRGKHG